EHQLRAAAAARARPAPPPGRPVPAGRRAPRGPARARSRPLGGAMSEERTAAARASSAGAKGGMPPLSALRTSRGAARLAASRWRRRARKCRDLLRNRGRGFRPRLFDHHELALPRKLWAHWWDGEHPDAPLLRFLAGAPGQGVLLDVGANVGVYSAAWTMATGRRHLALRSEEHTSELQSREKLVC